MPSWSSAHVAALAVVAVVVASSWSGESAPLGEMALSGHHRAGGTSGSEVPASRSDDARSVIGLIPSSDPQVTAALVEGATRALDEARAAGGPDLTLVVGAGSSAWSSVASEAVRLASEERVVAIVGPPERSLAHPTAQAATRCGVPLISTSAAASVTAAGSRWVVSVVECDAAAAPCDAGYDAARVVVEAVRRAGLRREAVLAAALDGTAVTGVAGPFRLGRGGRRESAAK